MEKEFNPRQYIYTQLQINLVADNMKSNKEDISVSFKLNKEIALEFMNSNISSNIYIAPIDTKYDADTCIMTFVGKNKDFDNEKDFKKYLLTTIADNELSSIKMEKVGFIKKFLQDKFFKSEIKFYKLDEMFDKSAFCAPLVKANPENPSTCLIDAGEGLRFEVSNGNFVNDLIRKMQDSEKYVLSGAYSKKENSIKSKTNQKI